jgi:hypothetical protein
VAGWLRRAGHLLLEDGGSVTWTVAEGRRGRRWRETAQKADADGLRHSLLLEIDPEGRFAHLELSTAAGLLTLHPEGDGTLHGNRVSSVGVDHVRGLPWATAAIVLVDGSPVSRFAAVPGLARAIGPGASGSVLVLRIPRDLSLSTSDEEVRRTDERRWTFAGPESYVLDSDGLLPPAPSPADWSLEEPS